jgi:hypothetical protein
MTVGKKRSDPKLAAFPFVTTREMVATSGLSADRLKLLRITQLSEKIYWFRPPGSIRVLWNVQLVRDWLLQGDTESHKRAVETFSRSLASFQ